MANAAARSLNGVPANDTRYRICSICGHVFMFISPMINGHAWKMLHSPSVRITLAMNRDHWRAKSVRSKSGRAQKSQTLPIFLGRYCPILCKCALNASKYYWNLCCGKIVANVICSLQRTFMYLCVLFFARARVCVCNISGYFPNEVNSLQSFTPSKLIHSLQFVPESTFFAFRPPSIASNRPSTLERNIYT